MKKKIIPNDLYAICTLYSITFYSTVASVLSTPIMQTRLLATTVLAMMIRFATFILPPSSSNKEDHIIPTLVSLLRESPKLDIKIRRRAIAALGEVIFYVSAQGGEGAGASSSSSSLPDDRDQQREDEANSWKIPSTALITVLKALKEDPDETIKHYSAKLIENVMAQGSIEYRNRLLSIETADRILDLVMTGRGEAIQLTCSMALFHILAFYAKIKDKSKI